MTAAAIWWGLAVYLAVALVIAVLARTGKAQDMASFFLGSRQMGGVVSALSYSATTYSAFMMIGLAGLTYAGGVGALGFEMIYLIGVSLVAVFGPRFWAVGKKYGFVTPSEMLGHRYASKAVAVAVALLSCLFLIPYSAVQLTGVGYLMSGMSEGAIAYTTGTVIATLVAVVFAYIAGIRSVAWTDSLQSILMMLASAAVAVLVVMALGGFSGMFDKVLAAEPRALSVPGPNGRFDFIGFLGLTIPWFFFSLSNPQVSQRLFMPASLHAMRRMLLGFMGFGFIYTLIAVLWGFAALAAFPGLERPDLASPRLLASDMVPPMLGIVVMISIMAAAISTIDSILLTLASVFARDVYANLGKEANERRQLMVGKIVTPVIALLAFAFAQLQLDLIAVLSVAASAGLVVSVPAIVGAFFWRSGTAAGALASVIGGGLFVLYAQVTGGVLSLPAGIWGIVVSSFLFIVVSLLTRAPQALAEEFISEAQRLPADAEHTRASV